jgi:NAD(P)H dehydrogenase (quinone)
MTSLTQPIAVFGATGAQGSPVARALLDAGRPVRAIARTLARLVPLAAQGAEVVAVDLADTDAVRHALDGVAGAFVYLPWIPVPEIVQAQTIAIATGLIDASVPLAVFTLSAQAPTAPIGVAAFDTRLLAKNILSESGASFVGFEPGSYLDNLCAPFSAPSVVYHDELRYALPADLRQAWISTQDQAALAIAALARPDLAGRWFRIGEQLTGPELAAGISAARGRDVRYVPLAPEVFEQSLIPVVSAEIAAALAANYRVLGSRPPALQLDQDTQVIRRELGVLATPVAEWARTQDWEAAASALGAH